MVQYAFFTLLFTLAIPCVSPHPPSAQRGERLLGRLRMREPTEVTDPVIEAGDESSFFRQTRAGVRWPVRIRRLPSRRHRSRLGPAACPLRWRASRRSGRGSLEMESCRLAQHRSRTGNVFARDIESLERSRIKVQVFRLNQRGGRGELHLSRAAGGRCARGSGLRSLGGPRRRRGCAGRDGVSTVRRIASLSMQRIRRHPEARRECEELPSVYQTAHVENASFQTDKTFEVMDSALRWPETGPTLNRGSSAKTWRCT